MQNHKIFEEYQDYCTISPGVDKRWIVGTEHRQLQIYEPEFETPKAMKTMMVDHLKRRFYIIDADIKVRKKNGKKILGHFFCEHKTKFSKAYIPLKLAFTR